MGSPLVKLCMCDTIWNQNSVTDFYLSTDLKTVLCGQIFYLYWIFFSFFMFGSSQNSNVCLCVYLIAAVFWPLTIFLFASTILEIGFYAFFTARLVLFSNPFYSLMHLNDSLFLRRGYGKLKTDTFSDSNVLYTLKTYHNNHGKLYRLSPMVPSVFKWKIFIYHSCRFPRWYNM